MKNTIMLAMLVSVLVIASIGSVIAPPNGNGVGSPDTECQNHGFDFGIAKYQCNSIVPEEGSAFDSYNITVEWFGELEDCSSVDWTADPAVDGILSKEGQDYVVYYDGTSGTIEKGDHGISHVTFCGDLPPVVPEFGATVGILTALGAVGTFFLVRRK